RTALTLRIFKPISKYIPRQIVREKETVMNSGTTRMNVRAALNTPVIIQGTDRAGKNFQIEGQSINFSRRGLGILVPRDLVAPGAVVSVTMPNKFRASGVVRWTRQGESTGQVRLGVQMLETKANLAVRIGASFLLCLALIGQMSFARSRGA